MKVFLVILLVFAGCKARMENARLQSGELSTNPVSPPTEELVQVPSSKVQFIMSWPVGSSTGGFQSFFGNAQVVSFDWTQILKLAFKFDMESLTTDDPKLTTLLKKPDFFNVDKYPTGSFVSTSIKEGGEKNATHTVTGNFTLREITKQISFPIRVRKELESIQVASEFFIKMSDYGIVTTTNDSHTIRNEVVIVLNFGMVKKNDAWP